MDPSAGTSADPRGPGPGSDLKAACLCSVSCVSGLPRIGLEGVCHCLLRLSALCEHREVPWNFRGELWFLCSWSTRAAPWDLCCQVDRTRMVTLPFPS